MTCAHGFIGACAECDGSGQIPEADTIAPGSLGGIKFVGTSSPKASGLRRPVFIDEPDDDSAERRGAAHDREYDRAIDNGWDGFR